MTWKVVVLSSVFYTHHKASPPLPPHGRCSTDTDCDVVPSYFSAPAANGLSTISHEYLKGSYALDLQAVKQGASSLPHLNKTLVSSCKRLNG